MSFYSFQSLAVTYTIDKLSYSWLVGIQTLRDVSLWSFFIAYSERLDIWNWDSKSEAFASDSIFRTLSYCILYIMLSKHRATASDRGSKPSNTNNRLRFEIQSCCIRLYRRSNQGSLITSWVSILENLFRKASCTKKKLQKKISKALEDLTLNQSSVSTAKRLASLF